MIVAVGETVRVIESERISTDLHHKDSQSAALLSAVMIDAVITEDAPLLEGVLQRASSVLSDVTRLAIRNERGELLAALDKPAATDLPRIVTSTNPIEFEGEKFGELSISWDMSSILQRTERAVRRVRLYALLQLLVASVFFFASFYWLVKKPLRRLQQTFAAIRSNDATARSGLSAIASRELHSLDHSLALLGESLGANAAQQRQLLLGRKRLAAVVEASIDSIIGVSEDGIIVEINRSAELCFGYAREAVLGRGMETLFQLASMPEGSAGAPLEVMLATAAANDNSIASVRALRADGSEFDAEYSINRTVAVGDQSLVVIYLRDVSERIAAERRIRALAKFADESPNPVLRLDPEGRVIYANRSSIFLHQTWLKGHSEGVPESIIAMLPDLLKRGDARRFELSLGERHLHLTLQGVPEGPYINIYGEDITQRFQAQKALELAKEQAEGASLAKASFLAMMSHEIRTPLNGVLGLLGILKDTSLTGEQLQYAATAEESARGLLAIINDVLDFSKMEANKLELDSTDFNLDQLVIGTIELLQPTADAKGLRFTISIEDDVPKWLRGDSGRLRQVLLNLLGNAVKFADDGDITLRACLLGLPQGQCELEFIVTDHGPGIPADKQTGLFAEFSQLDDSYSRRYGGTGLGLAISRRLVEMMHGDIEVDSVLGEYTTFRFTASFGLGQAVAGGTADKSDVEVQLATERSERILIVEDNPTNSLVFSLMLKKLGFQVSTACNGIEALSAVNDLALNVILMDISMPEMDGLQATRKIREQGGWCARIPIIALTAHAMSGDRERAVSAGMDDYLEKPIVRAKLVAALEHWLVERPFSSDKRAKNR